MLLDSVRSVFDHVLEHIREHFECVVCLMPFESLIEAYEHVCTPLVSCIRCRNLICICNLDDSE